MKKLPSLTAILWLLCVGTYIVAPRLVLNEFLQYPLIILLSILLPVSFWLKIQTGRKVQSLVFVALFSIDIVMLLFALQRNHATQQLLARANGAGILPQIAESLSTGATVEKRELAARIIYQEQAVAMPYLTADTSYVLYAPSPSDQERYRDNFAKNSRTQMVRMSAAEQMLNAFFVLVLHSAIFLAVLVFLLIYEQPPSCWPPRDEGPDGCA